MKIKNILKIFDITFTHNELNEKFKLLNYLKIYSKVNFSKKEKKKILKEIKQNNHKKYFAYYIRISSPKWPKNITSSRLPKPHIYFNKSNPKIHFLFENNKIYINIFYKDEYKHVKEYLKEYDCRVDFKIYNKKYNEVVFYNRQDEFKFKLLL